MAPSVSILIAAYNAGQTIGRTVDSLLVCQGIEDAQLIVVDDGSTDDTAARAERPGVEVLRRPHTGRAAALNAGLAAATGEVILFTDADCLAPPNWIADTLAELGDGTGIGGNLLPSRATAVELAKILRYVHEFESGAELRGQYTGVCLNGNNMAIRKNALLEIGGFDESFLHGADADLTRRLLAAGFSVRRVLQPNIRHLKVDTFVSFLFTMARRGSTVRFGMKSHDENGWTLLRGLLSPFKWLPVDLARVPRLVMLETTPGWRGWLAPLVNFAGGLVVGMSRIYYFMKFRRELP